MPSLVISKPCSVEPAVAQLPTSWFFPEQIQAHDANQQVYGDIFIASYVGSQLEIFPREAISDFYTFKVLMDRWRLERGSTSSTTDMVLCPAYQSIIGMGPRAIPLILSELASEGDDPDHWFWALQVLTGTNPVPEEDEGNLPRMAQRWLRWAADEGYAW